MDKTTSTSSVGSGISCKSAASLVTVTDNDNRIEHTRKTKKWSKDTETLTLEKDEIELTELLKLIQTTATKMEETSTKQKNVNMTVKRGIKTIFEVVDIALNKCIKTAPRGQTTTKYSTETETETKEHETQTGSDNAKNTLEGETRQDEDFGVYIFGPNRIEHYMAIYELESQEAKQLLGQGRIGIR